MRVSRKTGRQMLREIVKALKVMPANELANQLPLFMQRTTARRLCYIAGIARPQGDPYKVLVRRMERLRSNPRNAQRLWEVLNG